MHKKNVTDDEIRIVMESVYAEINKFLVPRQKRQQKEKAKTGKEVKNEKPALTEEQTELLLSVYENPNLSTTGHATKLGYSAYKMNNMKKKLSGMNLLSQFNINLGKDFGGNITLLELTDDGHKAIGKRRKFKKPKNVSREHFWWQRAICQNYIKKGINAEIEKAKNGKRADVGIVFNENEVAIEVELSPKNAISNIIEDLKAGFHKVYSCCKSSLVKREAIRRLEQYNDYESIKDRVSVRLLTDFEFVKEIGRQKI